MRILVQRVSRASVRVDGEVVGAIPSGLVALAGFRLDDTVREVRWLTEKLVQLRIFEDEVGKMNRSLLDVEGAVLAISQFTLYGDTRKGNRPNFMQAARPEEAERLYRLFVELLEERIGKERVQTGIFQAMMQVELVNEGPVTILLDKEASTPSSAE